MLLSMGIAIKALFDKQGWDFITEDFEFNDEGCVLVTSPDEFTKRIVITVKVQEMVKAYLVDITNLSGYPEDMLAAWMDFYAFLCDKAEFAGTKVYAEKGILYAFDSNIPQESKGVFRYRVGEFNNIELVEVS